MLCRRAIVLRGVAWGLFGALPGIACADPGLELVRTGDPNVPEGQPVTWELWLRDVSCDPDVSWATGFQAFLGFRTDRLAFVDGVYTTSPFGLALLPIVDLGGILELAAGIDPSVGQLPVCSDHCLATLSFTALVGGARCTDLWFRSHNPPSRIADVDGQAMTPLHLWATAPPSSPADFDLDCDVDYADFVVFSGCMAGPGITVPPPGCDPGDFAQADFDGDGDVDLSDFAFFQTEYTGP